MLPAVEPRQAQEQTILGILRGNRPLDLAREGAVDLLVRAVSAQPEFQRDISGQVITADLSERRINGNIREFRERCTAGPTQRVCVSIVRIETGNENWHVRLYNYDDREDMELLPAGHVRLGIECTPPLKDRIDEIRGRMVSSIFDSSDPASWL